MSKAFTRESDDAPEELPPPRMPTALPPGVKNYITADGARRFREELKQLIEVERPRLTAAPDPAAVKRELLLLDQRIAYLGETLHAVVIVDPPAVPDDEVRFGCTVTVRDKSGVESRYRLVGVEETDLDRDWISWRSPIARALLNRRVGERVRLRLPAGEEELQIVRVEYELFA